MWNEISYSGWGRALSAKGRVARPERLSALAQLSQETPAPAFGQLRSYGDAALNDGGPAVDMTRLDRMINFDPDTGIVHVEAGMPIGDMGRLFAARGWIPPVMPGTGFATVGGCIANDVHGKNHHVVGSFGQHVTEITLMMNGKAKKFTPDKTATLFKATVGGLGQTGVIVSAKIRLMPCKGDMMVLTERRIDGWDQFIDALDHSHADYTVGWIDATAKGNSLGRGILEEGEITSGVSPKTKKARAVPINAPHWALSGPVVRAFNEAYFRRVPAKGRTTVKPIAEPFFPLDAIHNWNRLYGKRGFHQFQCVVPLAHAPALRLMLERIANSGLASPLAVLKRMGAGRAGYLSFPMEGYTLAVDFPARQGSAQLIGELQDMTSDAQGRVYFAKDALASGGAVRAMYPEHGEWLKAVSKADPDQAMVTDLVRRLDLRSTQ
ncbi:FAD-binding protein [Aliiroseovarius sp. PTFE2010]|uniref:FAD-binding protein n=1 Tax=Aliiroseovarius sp. PTFE2010 TaxID=3417190 RepID=UPI003CE6A375